MTTNQIVRCAFGAVITYLAWQIILPVTNDVWQIILTILAELILAGILTYVMVTTGRGSHRTPSAVRDRIHEKIRQGRARFPKE